MYDEQIRVLRHCGNPNVSCKGCSDEDDCLGADGAWEIGAMANMRAAEGGSMKLLIDIPKEFEQHFQADRFDDALHRLSADAHLLAGLYEQETALMLSEAFKNAVPVPPHDGEAFEKVISERITQIAKWGDESRNHPFEWMSILGEEFGELCEAVNETCFRNGTHPERGGNENIIREAAQIAAVAITIIRDFAPTIIPAEEGE